MRYTLAITSLAILLLLVVAGFGGSRRAWRSTGPVATWLARLVLAAPVTVFVLQVLPWWRWSGLAVALAIAAGCLAGAALTAAAGRRSRLAGLVTVPVITAAVLLVDQLAGAPLQLSAPLGDNPLVAGRFHGMGNIDFASFATATLLCAGVAGGVLAARGRRTLAVVVAAAIGGLALVVDGAPPLGDDAGGAVTLLSAVVVLLAVLLGLRVTWRLVIAVLAVAVVAVLGVGLADHARGTGAETHLGRFVGRLLHGGGGTDVDRRLSAVGTSFGNVPFTLLAVAALAVVIAAWRPLRRRAAAVPGLSAALAGVATVAVLGTALNDSGVAVAGFAIMIALGATAGAGMLTDVANRPSADDTG